MLFVNAKTVDKSNKAEVGQQLDNPATFAKYVNVSAQCVRNWCKAGMIPLTINAGRIVRFERGEAVKALNR